MATEVRPGTQRGNEVGGDKARSGCNALLAKFVCVRMGPGRRTRPLSADSEAVDRDAERRARRPCGLPMELFSDSPCNPIPFDAS